VSELLESMNLQTGFNAIKNAKPEADAQHENEEETSFNEYRKEMGDDWLEKSIKQSVQSK
jgi:hypothetical protein